MLPEACGLGQHFLDLGHSFSLYGKIEILGNGITGILRQVSVLWCLILLLLFFNLGGSTELPLGPPEIDICENQTVVVQFYLCTDDICKVCHPSYA